MKDKFWKVIAIIAIGVLVVVIAFTIICFLDLNSLFDNAVDDLIRK